MLAIEVYCVDCSPSRKCIVLPCRFWLHPASLIAGRYVFTHLYTHAHAHTNTQDRILLLDTYFNVVVFHGETVAEWKRQNYQDNPEYVSFKQLLEAPQEEAKELMRERYPYPRFVDCNQHGSQARFLLSKVNPSSTHNQVRMHA